MIQMGVGTARLMAAKFQKSEQRGRPGKTSTFATGSLYLHPYHPRWATWDSRKEVGYFEKISESPTDSYYYSLSQQRVVMLVVVATAVGETELLGGTGERKAGIDASPDWSLVQKDCYGKSAEKKEEEEQEE